MALNVAPATPTDAAWGSVYTTPLKVLRDTIQPFPTF